MQRQCFGSRHLFHVDEIILFAHSMLGMKHQWRERIEDYVEDVVRMRARIINGCVPRQIQRYDMTIIMLYALTGGDNRYLARLIQESDGDFVAKKMGRNIGENNEPTIWSALSLAAYGGNIDGLRILLQSNLFDELHCSEAARIAALCNCAEAVTLLHQHKANLFFPDDQGMTTLHLSCDLGYAPVVQAILSTNPSEQQIGKPSKISNPNISMSAYEIAEFRQHHNCVLLLEGTESAFWKRKSDAGSVGNTQMLLALIRRHKAANPFLGDFHHRSQTVLIDAASEYTYSNHREMYIAVLEELAAYPPTVQIQALILTISYLKHNKPFAFDGDDVNVDQRQDEMISIFISKLIDLENQYCDMSEIILQSFPDMPFTKDEFHTIILNLISSEKIKKIDYSNDGTTNIHSSELQSHMQAIMTNTNLLECNLKTDDEYQDCARIVTLVIQRNREMAQHKSSVAKDVVYNNYLEEINSLVIELRKHEHTRELGCLVTITNIGKYRLQDMAALVTFHNTNIDPVTLTPDLQEIISDMKISRQLK